MILYSCRAPSWVSDLHLPLDKHSIVSRKGAADEEQQQRRRAQPVEDIMEEHGGRSACSAWAVLGGEVKLNTRSWKSGLQNDAFKASKTHLQVLWTEQSKVNMAGWVCDRTDLQKDHHVLYLFFFSADRLIQIHTDLVLMCGAWYLNNNINLY